MQKLQYDLIVAGGGFAGVAAAVAAAREGVRTLLIEKEYVLGGTMSHSLIYPFMKYSTEKILVNAGLFKTICDRLARDGAYPHYGMYHDEYLKLVFEELCAESGVEILYGAQIVEVQREGAAIRSVGVFTKSGRMDFSAKYFIDATGDANLSYMAGVPWEMGREADGMCQPLTLCFRVTGIDVKLYDSESREMLKLYQEYQRKGMIRNPRENILTMKYVLPGVIHFNSTRVVCKDPTDPFEVSKAQVEARRQVFELFRFLKANFASMKNAEIMTVGAEIGVRESRRIVGEYRLTKEDVLSYRVFPDSVACGAYEIDIHNPVGTGTELIYLAPGKYYTIPYRCLIPKTVDNMLVAGRCISSTHEAQSSYRIMPIVCCIGEGAGAAIAVANRNGTADVRGVDMEQVHAMLDAYGAKYR